MTIKYKFSELETLSALKEYIDKTYDQHYAKGGKIQTFELIAQKGWERGINFAIDNCLKYSSRQGEKKGNERSDILKIIHYAMMALHCYDRQQEEHTQEKFLDTCYPTYC